MTKYKPLVETVDEYGVLKAIKARTHALDQYDDLDRLLENIGEAKMVMLGEDTHGTHEFYTWRHMITRRLILEKGFTVITAEGDWHDGYLVNRFIQNHPATGTSAADVLKTFKSWPAWLWANREMASFMEWLQKYNSDSSPTVSFYGLDGYSLWQSLETILNFLAQSNPNALPIARAAYQCFEPYRNPETNLFGEPLPIVPKENQKEVIARLMTLRQTALKQFCEPEDDLCLRTTAQILGKMEVYYQTMIQGGVPAWNAREQHMAEMLYQLLEHHGPDTKAVVWAHNTHIGDARASVLLDRGMYNLGELARHRSKPGKVYLAGFGTYRGSVTAASQWGARVEKMELPPARPGSWDYLLHRAGPSNKLLFMHEFREPWFTEDRLDLRAIGAVYNPRLDAYYNYVPSELGWRYDAFLHVDVTSALRPLAGQDNTR